MKTLGDLTVSFQLYAVCTDCQRMERVDLKGMIERHGGDLTIAAFRRRLRCRQCQQRTGDIRIVFVGEKSKLAGFHYRGSGTRHSAQSMTQTVTQSVKSSVDSSVRPNPSTPT